MKKSVAVLTSLFLLGVTESRASMDGFLEYLSHPFKSISKFFEDRSIKSDVLKSFKNDVENNPFMRAAVDELIRLGLDRTELNAISVIDYATENRIVNAHFDQYGFFPKIVEKAMGIEFARSEGAYFESIGVGALLGSRAVRKLNLQATSPFLEEQRRAYTLYRYGID